MKEPKAKEKKLIYKAIDYNFIKDNYIKNTYSSRWKKDSDNSFLFSIKKEKNKPEGEEDKLKIIEDIFEIQDSSNIRDKYEQATKGTGMEKQRINVLHSSSLCAFLHFYKVDEKPIKINDIVYDEVYFEIQNKVFENHNPSNVDVTLISNQNKEILFLEAKFSEYLSIVDSYAISKEYKKIYEELHITDEYDMIEKNDKLILISNNHKKHYIGGIKQMISHYIGIKYFIKNKKSYDERIMLKADFNVKLGTILFDGWKDEEYLKDYAKEYKKLIYHFNNDENKPNNLKILDSILTYQEVFKKYNLDEKVKKYYRY